MSHVEAQTQTQMLSHAVVPEGLKLKGQCFFTESGSVDGEVDGKVFSSAPIILSQHGSIKGQLQATNCKIEGKLDGKILSEHEVEIKKDASVHGSIISTSLSIQEGASVSATFAIGKPTFKKSFFTWVRKLKGLLP